MELCGTIRKNERKKEMEVKPTENYFSNAHGEGRRISPLRYIRTRWICMMIFEKCSRLVDTGCYCLLFCLRSACIRIISKPTRNDHKLLIPIEKKQKEIKHENTLSKHDFHNNSACRYCSYFTYWNKRIELMIINAVFCHLSFYHSFFFFHFLLELSFFCEEMA